MLEYIQSLLNADLLSGFLWFGIVFVLVCIGEIILNFINMMLQKSFLYRRARKVLAGYSKDEIDFVVTYVLDDVKHLDGGKK